MWGPRIASALVALVCPLLFLAIIKGFGILTTSVQYSAFVIAFCAIATFVLCAFLVIGTFAGIAGVLLSFGAQRTPTGRFEPKDSWLGRKLKDLVDSGDYCAASVKIGSVGFCILVMTVMALMIMGFIAMAVLSFPAASALSFLGFWCASLTCSLLEYFRVDIIPERIRNFSVPLSANRLTLIALLLVLAIYVALDPLKSLGAIVTFVLLLAFGIILGFGVVKFWNLMRGLVHSSGFDKAICPYVK